MTWTISILYRFSYTLQTSCEGTSSKSFIQGMTFKMELPQRNSRDSRRGSKNPSTNRGLRGNFLITNIQWKPWKANREAFLPGTLGGPKSAKCGFNPKDFRVLLPTKGQYIGSSQMAFPLSLDFSSQDKKVKQSQLSQNKKQYDNMYDYVCICIYHYISMFIEYRDFFIFQTIPKLDLRVTQVCAVPWGP